MWKRAAAGLDEVGGYSCGTITSVRIPLPHFFAWTLELELEPWVSLWSNHFGEESTPPLAWKEGNKMPQPQEGDKTEPVEDSRCWIG